MCILYSELNKENREAFDWRDDTFWPICTDKWFLQDIPDKIMENVAHL